MKRFIKRKFKKKGLKLKNPLFFSSCMCKFCYDFSHVNERLYNVCDCEGSLKWCHVDCLKEWMKYKYNDKTKCDICGALYIIPAT